MLACPGTDGASLLASPASACSTPPAVITMCRVCITSAACARLWSATKQGSQVQGTLQVTFENTWCIQRGAGGHALVL